MSAATIISRAAIGLSVIALPAALTTYALAGTEGASKAQTGTMSQEELIKTARSAAPAAISKDATIAVHEDGKMRVLQTGTNEWTCMPGMARGGRHDPMCVDKNGMEWVHAWLNHKDPPTGKVGLGYMLAGATDASNTDPFAKEPEKGHEWIKTGPHIMIFGGKTLQEGLSASVEPKQAKPDTSRPFVMWAGTAYEHVMMPVK